MSNEFLLEVFFIKIKVKGSLKNNTEKTTEIIDTHAIKNKNKIDYINNETKYKIDISNDRKIILIRDNEKFTHKFIFDIDKITESEYYIKELNVSIYVKVKTNRIICTENKLKIDYEIIDNNSKCTYILNME